MIPVLTIVGRPNVGKSTLFNRLTRSRNALVHDAPGLTRDRHYGQGRLGHQPFLVVDTGGFEPQAASGITREMARQAEAAIAEADALLFVVDARSGLQTADKTIYERLRRTGRPLWLLVNKAEGMGHDWAGAEFHELGCAHWAPLSSAHGDGVREMLDAVLEECARRAPDSSDDDSISPDQGPRVAIVGRPNVGKSTLINTLLGQERVIAYDMPGTTRDAISVPFFFNNRHYTLVDTAGLRKKGRVFETVEKFSVIKTLQAIENSNVVILMLDAAQDISEQDAHIAGFCLEAGRALTIAVNKWESIDAYAKDQIKQTLARKLGFLDFADTHYISAQNGKGLSGKNGLLASVDSAWKAAMVKLPTPRITRVLLEAVRRQAPPRNGLSRPKPRYAHQGGSNPPLIVLHGNNLEALSQSYLRYIEHTFRDAFRLRGTPVRIQVKHHANPFDPR
jgi:GTP-binding protein